MRTEFESLPLAPYSTGQTAPSPRRGSPRLQAANAGMLAFPEQVSSQLAPLPLKTAIEARTESAPAPKPASVAPQAAAKPAAASTGRTLAGSKPLPEMHLVAPVKGTLQTAYQVQPFTAASLEQPKHVALPFRRKMVLESKAAQARAAAAAAGGALAFSGVDEQTAAPADSAISTGSGPKLNVQPVRGKSEPEAAPAPAPEEPKKQKRQFNAPTLGVGVEESGGIFSKIPMLGWLGLAATLMILTVVYIASSKGSKSDSGSSDSSGTVQDLAAGQSMAGSGWVTDYAAGAGANRARQLTIFKQSVSLQNYRLNFSAQIQSKSLSWVFRAQDMKNYYGMRLELNAGPGGQAALYKFAVVDGQEGPRLKIPVPFPINTTTPVQISEVVRGPKFTVYVQGQLLDTWSDTSHKSGGIGFMRERGEVANILNVQVLREAVQ